jgi:hypothetical protein
MSLVTVIGYRAALLTAVVETRDRTASSGMIAENPYRSETGSSSIIMSNFIERWNSRGDRHLTPYLATDRLWRRPGLESREPATKARAWARVKSERQPVGVKQRNQQQHADRDGLNSERDGECSGFLLGAEGAAGIAEHALMTPHAKRVRH